MKPGQLRPWITRTVCKVHEVGEVNGRPFIAMECISGETLKHELRANRSGFATQCALPLKWLRPSTVPTRAA